MCTYKNYTKEGRAGYLVGDCRNMCGYYHLTSHVSLLI